MAGQKGRIAPKKGRTALLVRKPRRSPGTKSPGEPGKVRPQAARRSRTAALKAKTARRKGRSGSTKEWEEAQRSAFQAFDQQIDPLWDRLANGCRQFAEGFNQEMGADQLHVDNHPAGLIVRMTTDGAEAFFQLDRTERHVTVASTSGCTNFGACTTVQVPVGLTILEGQLRLLLGGKPISEEELAVKILSDLLEAETS
jgi:hypothetical protein